MVDLSLPEAPPRIQRDRDSLAEAPALRRALIGFAVTVLALKRARWPGSIPRLRLP